jgi:hypothetical protein
MKYLCVLIVMMTAAVPLAANPLGRITSSGSVMLNGKLVPATAAASLPVVAGDEIVTSKSSAKIYFDDKSSATIEPNSRLKLEAHNSSVSLRVFAGSVDLKRAEGSRISLVQPNRPTPMHSGAKDHDKSRSEHKRHPKPPPRSPHGPPGHDHDHDHY